jgi:hypothetical protein
MREHDPGKCGVPDNNREPPLIPSMKIFDESKFMICGRAFTQRIVRMCAGDKQDEYPPV